MRIFAPRNQGVLAQLVERLNGIQKVRSSILLCSTTQIGNLLEIKGCRFYFVNYSGVYTFHLQFALDYYVLLWLLPYFKNSIISVSSKCLKSPLKTMSPFSTNTYCGNTPYVSSIILCGAIFQCPYSCVPAIFMNVLMDIAPPPITNFNFSLSISCLSNIIDSLSAPILQYLHPAKAKFIKYLPSLMFMGRSSSTKIMLSSFISGSTFKKMLYVESFTLS